MNETVVVGAALLILLGAVAFYLYSRITYVENKIRTVESVIMDIKMTLDMMVSEEGPEGAAPVMPLQGGEGRPQPSAAAPVFVPMPAEDDEAAPAAPAPLSEESFYSSVLEKVEDLPGVEVLSEQEGGDAGAAAAEPNYDVMSRADLVAEAERRGLRIPKRTGRGEIISLLRKTPAPLNRGDDQGAVSSQDGNGIQSASVDNSSMGVGLEQDEAADQGLDAALGPSA
jgi:hypothetical protein